MRINSQPQSLNFSPRMVDKYHMIYKDRITGDHSAASPSILKGPQFTARLLQLGDQLPPAVSGENFKYRRILIPAMLGGEIQFALLGFLAQSLRMRGAEVTGLLCDQFLPACTVRKVDHYECACTRWCYKNIGSFVRAIGLPHRWYSEFVTSEEVETCLSQAVKVSGPDLLHYEWHGLPLGEHIDVSVESHFKVGYFDLDNPEMVSVGQKFLASAMLLILIGERALEQLRIDKVVVEDGRKTDWGILRHVALRRGIPVDILESGARGQSVVLEHHKPGQPYLRMPEWSTWKEQPLQDRQRRDLEQYFMQRITRPYAGSSLCSWTKTFDREEFYRRLNIPEQASGVRFGLFPNQSHEFGLIATQHIFQSPRVWASRTIDFFRRYSEHLLVIKVHPSEMGGRVMDPLISFLDEQRSSLPRNVRIIPSDSPLTAHEVIQALDICMVYTSTVAVEAAYWGKPVILVGGGTHSRRGITIDTCSEQHYFDLLQEICQTRVPPPPIRDIAERYAYSFFFRSTLPYTQFRVHDVNVTEVLLQSWEDLLPGRDPVTDLLCRGILMDEGARLEYWPDRFLPSMKN